ncbi:Cellulose synthase catalytic subunit A [UDP-forming] [Cyphellophora attinorum]|uniref:Cellulose synthase catalytic subunit A [UDP-forming] n=1 Tax=Cyphellophora attinorum TaxID=1664694 RepID=A0A0N1H8X5_9EURO|nr:Cellulose synthase catalytic subunit A [UDP-forming] [Phialophora attinorum]KPI43642.1 Cellulose synthase catalytic subunit A [UDP-forming] [Phialophora attinorum]
MNSELPNGLVITDSSKVTVTAEPKHGYDIETFAQPSGSFFSKFGRLVAATQLASLVRYLYLLKKAAEGGSLAAKLLLVQQLIEHVTTVADLTVSITGQALCKQPSRPKRRIHGDNVPGVDVIITVCKEDVDIIMDTAAVEGFAKSYPHVHYYSRPKVPGRHHGFKAGNMNQAIRYLADNAFEGPKHDWVACLDADMIPDDKWLRALVPHVLLDSDIGMIATPQDFYNIPVNDPLHDNLHLQHEAEQNLRDRLGAAWCVGSGFLFYRPAWEKIGGFSETSMCDDVLFGWTLNGHGYKTAAISERLQQGMQPSSFIEHMKQRRRWFIGGIQNARQIKFGFDRSIYGDSSAWQKLAALNQIPKPFLGTIGKLLSWVLVFGCICMNTNLVVAEPSDLASILKWYAAYTIATRVSEYVLASSGFGIQNIRRRQIVSTWQGVHLSKASLQEVVPAWLGGVALKFAVTGQKADVAVSLEERDLAQRPGLLERVRRLHQVESVLVHLHIFFFIVSAIIACAVSLHFKTDGNGNALLHALIVSSLFPGLKIENLAHFLSPIWYIMFPPVERERTTYLTEVPNTGFRRPLLWECGARFTRGMYVWELGS